MVGPSFLCLSCTFLGTAIFIFDVNLVNYISCIAHNFIPRLMLTNLVNVKNDMNIYFIDSLFVLYGRYVKALPSVNRTPVASSYTNVKSLSIILLFCQNQWNIRDMYLCCGLYCASYYNLFSACTKDNNPSWLIICVPFSLSYCNTLWSVEIWRPKKTKAIKMNHIKFLYSV